MSNLLIEIEEQRQKEILEGKHAWTVPPLYVVYEQTISVCNHRCDIPQSTTLFSEFADILVRFVKESSHYELADHEMFKDSDPDEEITINLDEYNSGEDTEYTAVMRVGFHDKFVNCCFTRQAAEEFIEGEKHNLNNPQIYVHAIMRRNWQLIQVGKLFGDKN